jgi:uncharacterized protein (DUF58 family)
MDHSEILKQVRKIELKMRGLAQHVFAGQYQSAFKGRGMSFSEVRAYQYGDDVRSIDWNVTARFRSPHIKVFEEERELSVFLVIDVSGSMYFGMSNQSKISLAVLLVATLGFSAATNGDKVGVVLVSDEVEDYIPPKKGADHVHFIIRRILNLNPKSKKTDFSAGIKLLLNLHKQKSICFVLSDFPNPSGMKDDLLKLKKKHDVIGIQLSDEGERTLPKVGFVRWYNAETQSTSWIDTSSGVARKEIESKKQKRDLEIQQLFHSIQLDFLALDTSQDPYNQLVTLFRHRK